MDSQAFSLVLLAMQPSQEHRTPGAIQRACGISPRAATRLLTRPLPIVLTQGLSYADAAIGQYELIACDAVSVIIPDGVMQSPPPGYLDELYAALLQGPEFEMISVVIETLPSGAQKSDFLKHFLGLGDCETPLQLRLMRKKARIMAHLAAKIGGRMLTE